MKHNDSMKFYRYEDYPTYPRIVGLGLKTFALVKETPKGYWIIGLYDKKRWISKTTRKRYAYPTKEEALKSFIARKNRQIIILKSNLYRAQSALRKAKNVEAVNSVVVKSYLEVR